MTDPYTHPPDDDLVLLFYGELPEDQQADVSAHIGGCAPCREAYHALTRTLHLAGTFQAPDPGADFEARVWSRLEPEVARHRGARPGISRMLAWAAALAMMAGGTWWVATRVPAPPVPAVADVGTAGPADQFRERVLLSAVDAHLEQTEMLFVELLNAPAEESTSLDYARQTAGDLVASGRLYRETALDTGDAHLVAMLDELEPVLVEVARSGDRPDSRNFRALRGRIEQDDLLFKVRAVSADIQDRQDRTPSGEGAL